MFLILTLGTGQYFSLNYVTIEVTHKLKHDQERETAERVQIVSRKPF